MLTVGSLFTGIGGMDLGLEQAGMEIRWMVEINPFCQKVLAKHWPNVRRYGDVRDCGKHNLEPVDLICGGFPCQDVSLAGKRRGLNGKRSTLWDEFYRIICEIHPRWIIIENVPGLYSSNNGRFFAKILRELAQSGYDAEWNIIPAIAVGAPHIRQRVFIVAYTKCNGWNERGRIMGNGGKNNLFKTRNSFQNSKDWKRVWSEIARGGTVEVERPNPVTYGKWAVEPNVGRVANGIPDRVDRLKALGNAVVPQVAGWVGKQILEAHSRP